MEIVEKLKSKKSRGKKWIKRILYTGLFFFVLVNCVAFIHARKFTHFVEGVDVRPSSTGNTPAQVAKTLLLGVDMPRPKNDVEPQVPFKEIWLTNENGNISSWWIEQDSAKGIIILSHGYGACKSKMLPVANAFIGMGYSTFIFDSTGSGDSEGNHCTIGYKEAKDLKTVYNHVKDNYKGDIYTFGSSMGAALTLKSIAEEGIDPKGVILHCPFGSMEDAVKGKFRNMGVPFWGLGHLLVFWGGAQNGFNGFKYKPSEYAKNVRIPTLLIWGAKDLRVTKAETELIYENLAGEKELIILENAAHSGLISSEPTKWRASVRNFLNEN